VATEIIVFQGEDKTINVDTGTTDLSASLDIEFNVNTSPQIVKRLSATEITGLTATRFLVILNKADTASVPAGPYRYQLLVTDANGKLSNGVFKPNKFTVMESNFVNQGSGNDYN